MPRKPPVTRSFPDWYLPEWMETLAITQAQLARKCDWSKGTMSDIYHGKTAYYRQILNTIAAALQIEPYELLMHPAQAMAIRRQRQDALRIAAEEHRSYVAEPDWQDTGT